MSNWFSTQDETSLVQCFYHEMKFIDVIESFIVPHLFENECKPIEKVSVPGADPGFFLGGGAPLRNDVTDGEV